MLPKARIALALIVALTSVACSAKHAAPPAGPTIGLPLRRVLPNGVRVIVQEHRGSDVVALQLWVRAGGRDETASQLGLAHYLEHMLFKGTPTRASGFIDREVEGVGGRMNAGTSLDYTYYHMMVPSNRALGAIDTLADISVNATLDESLLDREKAIVLEELRRGEDNPNRVLMRHLYAAMFDGHPYGRPVIGTAELIRGLTREQLLGFYRGHYVPEAFTLVVVGAIDPADVLAEAARTFGRVPRSGVRALPAPAAGRPRDRREEVTRQGSQAYVAMGWLAPKIAHGDTPAVDLLMAILGETRSSRLPQLLRERLGLVTWVASSYSALEGAGLVTVSAQLEPTQLSRVESEILGEIRRVRDLGVTEAELRRAITAATTRQEFQMETAEGRARIFGRAETIWRLEDELAYVDRLQTVTREQVRAAARRYLDPDHYTRVALLPGSAR